MAIRVNKLAQEYSIRTLHPKQAEIIEKLFNRIIEFYGDNLVSLAVFGSFARGEPKLNSDIDILIILERKEGIGKEIQRFQEHIERVVEEGLQELYEIHGINMEISPFILSYEDAKYFNPIYLDMVEHSIIIFDRDNFLKRILEKMREKMDQFQKYEAGTTYIWDMTRKNLIGEKLL